MPNKPKKIRRAWTTAKVKQSRSIDMRWFYNTSKWRNFSKAFKRRNPLCVECEKKGIITPSAVTDHKVRYVDGGKGFDLDDLKDEYFQALCDSCHNKRSGKQAHGLGGMG